MTTSWPSPQFSARRLPPQDWEPRRRRNSVAGLGVTVIWGQRAVTPRGREAARTAPPSQDSKPGPVGPAAIPGRSWRLGSGLSVCRARSSATLPRREK